MADKIRLVQVAYKSEWALAKFFQALREPEVASRYELRAICGREETKQKAMDSLERAILDRIDMLASGKFRPANRRKEAESCLRLLRSLADQQIKYYQVNGDHTLPAELYREIDAVVLHSKNTTHLGYILDAIKREKHVICEKPLVTLINERGEPKKEDLERLMAETENIGSVLMDAEHYSYKKAALTFYENLDFLLENGKRKIKQVHGEIKEFDSPDFGRTKDILNLGSETGILTDTGVHLLAFISNLGARATPTSAKYDRFKGYDVETSFRGEYAITGNNRVFAKNATFAIDIAKFTDLFINPELGESKLIRFTLDDDTEIIVDFSNGIVKKGGIECTFRYSISNNEYTNIFGHFFESLNNKTLPLTRFSRSIKTLDSIYQTYNLFPLKENSEERYRR